MKTPRLVLLLAVITLLLHSCSKSGKDFDSDYTLFREYITSYSSGIVPSKADIQVGLAFAKAEWKPNDELDSDYFTISPKVEGKVIYLADNSIAFRPSKRLEQDTEYRVTLHLSKFIKVPPQLADFNFRIKAIRHDFVVTPQDLQSHSRDWQYLNGQLKASDDINAAIAQKLVTAEQDGRRLPVRFDRTEGSASSFHFVVDSIRRRATSSTVKISWNGKPYNIDREGSQDFEIPGKDTFKVISMIPAEDDNQTLLVNFTDPLRRDQDFSGLVSVENVQSLRYAVEGNLLKVFFAEPLNGSFLVEVFQGIESIDGIKTNRTHSEKIAFEQMKPEVRYVKSGTILPASSNLKLNFQAVNLSAVDVKVYRIFENNVLQYLQDGELADGYGLRNVALPIAKRKLILNTNKMLNYGKWNYYAIDLATLIKPQQGAIYRVTISFKKAYSLYKCGESAGDEEEEIQQAEEQPEDFSEYQDYDYYPYDYNWDEQENPCSHSYYYGKQVSTNVLASDLGVIAKKGEDDSFFFAVTSITTTEPVAGAIIELYNFQKQKLATATTGASGTAMISSDKKPFFAVVKNGNSTTYVKMGEGTSKSLSNFDVDGERLQKGLKGFLYGERGVWRPGDTLFLGFILNDKASKLPMQHPVKLRLSDPNGKMVYEAVQSYNPKNHFRFIVPTHASVPTGSWEARVSVGGAHFYKAIKIEAIKPNRLRVRNSLEGKTIYASRQNNASLEVAWLHGAVARDLKVDMQAKFIKQETRFKGYLNYVFDDPTQTFGTEEVNLFSGRTDANGMAQLALQPRLQVRAPGLLKAAIITKAYEKGGDFSTDVVTATYSPYDTYVGVKAPAGNKYGMLETGKANRFELATVNDKGQPRSNRQLDVRVYKVEWRWWWDASNDDLSTYSATESRLAVYSQSVTTDASGKASFNFTTNEDAWGRYLIRVTDVASGHSAGQTVLIDYPSWSGRTHSDNPEGASMLMFTTDKEKYAVGEKAVISFPSSEGGRALISLENGSRVVQTYWARTKKGETKVEIPIAGNLAPNVYVHVTLLQPHASTKNDSPIRLYGIVPIEVVDKNTILEPQIKMPEVLKPLQNTTVKVSEKNGRPMTYTIAIVDDGLLDLTRFKTPNAWDSFYAREALGVKTWDVYDDVIGAYGGEINQVFSIGGDADLGGGKARKANRFKPVVIFMGPYTIGKGQTRVHNIKLPNYVGSVRTMVVAANADMSAYGMAEKTTPVRSPLMLLASLPRKVTPGERVTLPVTLFAMESHVKNVTLQVKTNNGIKVMSRAAQSVAFARPEEKVAYFDLQIGQLTGLGKVTVTAISGREKASYDVELDIVNPNPVTQNFKELVLEPGRSGTVNWNSFGVSGSNSARLEVSSFPSIDFNRRLDYLVQYPHGCLEQVTSSAFPQLYLTDIADVDNARKQKIQANVTAAIQKLTQYQVASGGFAYWPGQPDPDDWGSSYVGHFLIEAEQKGYSLPLNSKKQWLAYQQKAARQWRYSSAYHNDFAQAYRLYTLALAGVPDLSSMNRLRETNGISNESRLRLAAAYALAGQKSTGQMLLGQSSLDVNSPYGYYYYGSPERNRAMALETLVLLGQKQKAYNMAVQLAKAMSSNQWMSTQTTAYSLYAMSKFAKSNGEKGVDATYTVQGKQETIKTGKTFASRALPVSGSNSVSLKNNRKGTLYVKVVYSGVLPVGKEQAEQRGLVTSVTYRDRAGNAINPGALAQGTEFVAEVTVTNTKSENVENMAFTQIIPSGWEIVNTRFTEFGDNTGNSVDYTDIRDDRANYYFPMKARETKKFRLLLNASYPGTFYLPGSQCEAMYDNSFYARTRGQWVKVVKAN